MSFKSHHHLDFVRISAQILAILILLGGFLGQAMPVAQAAPLQATITVTTTNDEYGTNMGACSLREAVEAANTDTGFGGCPAGSGADTITLGAGTYTLNIGGNNEQDNATGDLDILSNLTIQGTTGTPANVIIRGGAGWDDKIIDINPLIDRVLTVTINGVTVRDGNNTSDIDWYGGGIQAFGRLFGDYSSTGTLNLQNCIVTNNTYAGSRFIDEGAGGLLAEQIHLNIDNCTFSNNSAGANGNGGGISNIGINENISITNSRFTGNTSPSNPGGAIYLRRVSGGGYPNVAGTVTLEKNTFESNSSTYGGAIYVSIIPGGNPVSISVNAHHSVFAGNAASVSGSGLYYSGDTPVPTLNFENNWWGCSAGPSGTPCNTAVVDFGTLDTNPWLRNQLTAATSPLVVNQSTNLTASYLTNSSGAAVLASNLTQIENRGVTWGASLGSLSGTQAAVQANGTATGSFQASGAGTAVIYARVDQDSTSGPSSNVLSLTVNKANTTTAIASALPNPSNVGQAVTVNYTVTGAYGNSPTAPTGNVTVSDGVDSCTGTVAAGSCNLTFTTPGSKTLTATYAGDSNFNASPASAGVAHTVNQAPTLTSLNNTTFTVGSAGTFTVTTSGSPTGASMVISLTGALPAGVTFTDNHDGTATLSGTPGTGTGNTYPLTITANNGISPEGTQAFTLTVNEAPAITSANTTTFTETVSGTFTVTTTGFPTGAGMTISQTGALPVGVTFTDNNDGTATLAGTPSVGSYGSYPITITAGNGVGTNATQNFTLVVQPDLQITSVDHATFTIATVNSFTVQAVGSPIPGLAVSGTLPSGVTFVDNLDGTGTLSGTPAAGSDGVYPITFTASNGAGPDVVQNFTLTVNLAATTTTLTSDTPDPSVVGQAVTFNFAVSPVAPATGTPGGNVTVSNGTDSCSATVAVGSCTITFTAPGTSNFTATYAGDTSFAGSASTAAPHTVDQAGTTTTLISDAPDPSVVGQIVTFNYAVSVNAPGAGAPTGNVTVSNGTDSCTGTVAASSCTITFTASGTSNFTATYAGDANFAGSASTTTAHTVDQAATTTALTAAVPDPSVVGQTVTFNYTVSVSAPGAGTPTGNVTVSNGTESCTGTVAAGACTITLTSVGTRNFTASYAGDANFAGSISAPISQTVNQAATATTLNSVSPTPSIVGQTVTFTYAVSVLAPGAGTPTGSVTVSNGTDSCTGTVAAGSCDITFAAPGTSNFTATYAGDANFAGSASPATSHTINQAGTTTLLISDTPDPSVVGQLVTFNYSVSVVAPGVGTPTGNVTVSNGTDSCTGTVAAGSCTITLTAAGTSNFTATYAGDASFAGSSSSADSHTVNQAGTTTSLISDTPDPSVVGQAVTFNYAVSVSAPGSGTSTGNVTISNGTESCTGTVAAGSCTITFTAPGTSNFTASYAGDANFTGSVSIPAAHTVNQAGTTTTITADTPDPSLVGQAVTISFTVVAAAPGAGTPTGDVTVSDGTDSCTGSVAAGSCVMTFTSLGTKTLTATYAGDTNFTTSASATETHVVALASTTTSITSDAPDPSGVGIPVPIAYTVAVVAPGTGTPIGDVTISDGVDSCTASVAAGTCSITFTTVGARILTATYAGDANFGGSTAAPEAHTVEGPPGVSLINSVADTGDGQLIENEQTNAAITQLLVVFNKALNPTDAGTAGNYHLRRDGSAVDLVASVAYDNATLTTTVNLTAPLPLPDGKYTLTIDGAMKDNLGSPIGADFVRIFNVDTAGIQIKLNGATMPDGTIIVDGSTLNKKFSDIWINFTEDAANPPNDTHSDDVTNPANYLLVRPGQNAKFDTVSCQAKVAGDDVVVPTGPVVFENGTGSGPFVARVRVNNGAPLENGIYRLFICGTTSITDLAGNPLNDGADSLLSFTVLALSDQIGNPATGFEPGVVTSLPSQPAEKAYTDLGNLWIEIPSLGVNASITGVPLLSQGWDLAWLDRQVGWLAGTAYPTWNGNTVLTAHAYTPDGLPGPFAQLKNLKYGDTFVIHFDGQKYTYTVSSRSLVKANDTTLLTRHETLDWVTLITCQQFDEKSQSYLYRWVVRAVLTSVQSETLPGRK